MEKMYREVVEDNLTKEYMYNIWYTMWRYKSPHYSDHDLMIKMRVDQSISQYDNYIMTLLYDRFNYSGLSWWPSSSKTDVKNNVKTDVKSDPVDDTQ